MSPGLCDLSAVEIAERVRRGSLRAADVLESALDRIRQVDGRPGTASAGPARADDEISVHAFITLTTERARQQAEVIDRRVAQGEDPGPLAGVPLAVKDIFCVRGTPSTAASRILETFVSPYTATPVERLEAAGAITVGKVNLDEFTFGSSNESTAFQPAPRNPWDPACVPGGSSGGSAAAVAAGEAVLSLGTDTAGSIRQPAAFCGVVGLKPTYGRVSRYGLIAFASSLDCPGPVARDVADAARMLQVCAGADPRDATSVTVPVPDYTADLGRGVRGLRIGLSPDYFRLKYPDPATGELAEQPIHPEVEAAVLRAAELLARQGAEIVEGVPMPNTRFGIPAYFVISRVEAASNLHRYDGVKYGPRAAGVLPDMQALYRRTRGGAFGLQPKLRILMGMYVSAEQYEKGYYQRALQVRTMIRRDFEQAFDPKGAHRLDCLLTATTPTTAFEMNAVYGNSVLMQYADLLTVAADHAGIPGLSVPGGLDGRGRPIGVQLLGPDFAEGMLLRVARAYEQATAEDAWRRARPRVLGG
jgi:aspartyl-tRNA(Asn)/glutamyl-tRNA(Gln) amidotransferase subunit A